MHFKREDTIPLPPGKAPGRAASPAEENRLSFMFELLFDALEDSCTPGSFIHIAQALSLIPAQLRCRNYTSGKAAQNKYLPQAIRCMYRELARTLTLDELAGVRQVVLPSFLTICSICAFI